MRSVLCHIPVRLPIVLACLALVGCGCNTTPESTEPVPSPLEVAEAWRLALIADDMRSAMGLVSPEFSSEVWSSHQDLADYLNLASSRGFFDDAVSLDDEAVESATRQGIEIYPISMRSSMGTTVFRLTLVQRDIHWEIVTLSMEIY